MPSVRACVVRRRRTRDGDAGSTDRRRRRRRGDVGKLGRWIFGAANESRRVEYPSRVPSCARRTFVTAARLGEFLRTTDTASGPPRTTIDTASLDFRDPAGKLRRHARNITTPTRAAFTQGSFLDLSLTVHAVSVSPRLHGDTRVRYRDAGLSHRALIVTGEEKLDLASQRKVSGVATD